ncbi:hypothetical protein JCM10207_009195 [Rhodosporidiobolus poonsookiae]
MPRHSAQNRSRPVFSSSFRRLLIKGKSPICRCLCHVRPPPPPSPTPSPPPAGRLPSLPAEVLRTIVDFLVTDDREESNAALKAVMLVNRTGWKVAAPLFWRTVILSSATSASQSAFPSPACLSLMRDLVVLPPTVNKADLAPFQHLPMAAYIIATAPALVNVEVCLPAHLYCDSIGLTVLHSLSNRPHRFEALTCKVIKTTFMDTDFSLSHLRSLLLAVDGSTLTSLRLHQVAFKPSNITSLSQALQHFTNLRSLSLSDFERADDFHISELVVDSPLVSLTLDLGTASILPESLLRHFCNYQDTLEHLDITCRLGDQAPPAVLRLPKLRHLRLAVPQPHVLAYQIDAPFEVLDLTVHKPGGPKRVVDFYPHIRTLSSTLRIFLSTQSLVDLVPDGGLDAVTSECKQHGALILWRGADKSVGEEMDELDRWTREWSRDGDKTSFLKAEYLAERSLTAEMA